MNKTTDSYKNRFIKKIEDKKNKIKSGKLGKEESYIWLRIFGIIGWSVVVPLLLGVVLGIQIDKWVHSKYSFTLMLMIGGLAAGCLNAWNWLKKLNK